MEDEQDEVDYSQWQQLVLQRVNENVFTLGTLLSSGCDRLVVLNLQRNSITDLEPIQITAGTLRYLDVSFNSIAKLPGRAYWKKFKQLTFCFLEANALEKWTEIQRLHVCSSSLLWLKLAGNPVMEKEGSRQQLILKLPFLKAIDKFTVSDVEVYAAQGGSTRPSLLPIFRNISVLAERVEFDSDNDALEYVESAKKNIQRVYRESSPVVLVQRIVRGYLSRSFILSRISTLRQLVLLVQKVTRGFLLRINLRREFVRLMGERGEKIILLGYDGGIGVPSKTARGLNKLTDAVREWKDRYHHKKERAALNRIRAWCRMMRRQQKLKAERLVRSHQEILLYYTPDVEDGLRDLVIQSIVRDPFLVKKLPSIEDRIAFFQSRCLQSGVRLLRRPQDQSELKGVSRVGVHGLMRIFSNDMENEFELLHNEKSILIQDIADISTCLKNITSKMSNIERVDNVYLPIVKAQLEKRLTICSKKLRRSSLRAQTLRQGHANVAKFAITRTKIRVRGFNVQHNYDDQGKELGKRLDLIQEYPTLKVFVAYSIDMFLQLESKVRFMTKIGLVSKESIVLSHYKVHQHTAVTIMQATWWRYKAKRKDLELQAERRRALVCLQRWWRWLRGTGHRLAFLRECLLLGSTINSNTLFMEEHAFRLLTDPSWWSRANSVMRPCQEHELICRIVGSCVQVALPSSYMQLYAVAKAQQPLNKDASRSVKAATSQRCGAYLPLWLPDCPVHKLRSIEDYDDDATSRLLLDKVLVEPTLLERELIIATNEQQSESSGMSSSYRLFNTFGLVNAAQSRVLRVAKKLARHTKHSWQLKSPLYALETTSFVRLTFDSLSEARRRALILLHKTYDPISGGFARLYSLEVLLSAGLRHHQWAISQIVSKEEVHQLDLDCRLLLPRSLPSPWLSRLEAKLNIQPELLKKVNNQVYEVVNIEARDSLQQSKKDQIGKASPCKPSIRIPSLRPYTTSPKKPAEIRVISNPSFGRNEDGKTRTPCRPDTTANDVGCSSGWSRHRLLLDKAGCNETVISWKNHEEERNATAHKVRALREEEDRAVEAEIVDRRLRQREKAAEIAGDKMAIDVQLQRQRYEREIAKIEQQERMDKEKMASRCRKLAQKFEDQFVVQTGAMMRLKSTSTIQRKLRMKDDARTREMMRIRSREEGEKRRRDLAETSIFARKHRTKQEVRVRTEGQLEKAKATGLKRLRDIRRRMQEDRDVRQQLCQLLP